MLTHDNGREEGNGEDLARSSLLLLKQGSKNMLHERRECGEGIWFLIKPILIPVSSGPQECSSSLPGVQEIERKNSKKCS
jgi:hypothetical protein